MCVELLSNFDCEEVLEGHSLTLESPRYVSRDAKGEILYGSVG